MERKSLYIFFLSITAIFTYCLGMTDTHILPKWLYTLGAVAVVGMVEGFALLLRKQSETYEKPLLIAKRCRKYWADYDLELLQGELLVKLERYEEAEHHFLHASRMCPVRFVPLYQLYQLYKNIGNEEKARRMGEMILNKPVKVDSAMINSIKANVLRDFLIDNLLEKDYFLYF